MKLARIVMWLLIIAIYLMIGSIAGFVTIDVKTNTVSATVLSGIILAVILLRTARK